MTSPGSAERVPPPSFDAQPNARGVAGRTVSPAGRGFSLQGGPSGGNASGFLRMP
jgi:hypothetical protein